MVWVQHVDLSPDLAEDPYGIGPPQQRPDEGVSIVRDHNDVERGSEGLLFRQSIVLERSAQGGGENDHSWLR
jgi:hypothetical protein